MAAETELARWRARVQELEATQWALERRIFQLETLAAIAREAGSCHDLRAAARSVLNVLSGTFGAVSGAVLLLDEETDTWTLAAARGIPDESPLPPAGAALIAWLAGRRAPESPTDLSGAGLDELVALLGGVTAAIPMVRQGEATGLILLGETLSGDALDADDLELCASAGAAAATLCGDILSTDRYLREQKKQFGIRAIFEQYCAPDVVEILLKDHRIGGQQKTVTIVMADIRGFTGAVQQTALEQAAHVVNDYFTAMTDLVFAHGGTMDKFMGDAVMVVFGDPGEFPEEESALRAVHCAAEMQHRFAEVLADHAHLDIALGLGIGVATGRALCGVFGSEMRFQYTVIGQPVNLAARLSDLAHSGEVFLDQDTRERLAGRVPTVPLTPVWLKGFSQPLPVYRLHSGEEDADQRREH